MLAYGDGERYNHKFATASVLCLKLTVISLLTGGFDLNNLLCTTYRETLTGEPFNEATLNEETKLLL